MLFGWADQIGEASMAIGIIVLAAVFGLGDGDPIKRVHKVPMCRVTCVVESTLEAPLGTVTCTEQTEDVWNDFIEREVAKDPHNYCGACGTPVDCEKVRYR
jgi:hypothetical protein